MIPKPLALHDLPAGYRLHAGLGFATVLPDHDVETYSPAGFVWDEEAGKFYAPEGATKKGLGATGSAVYTEHPDAEVLSLAYDLKDGKGRRFWRPNWMLPEDYCNHITRGGLLEAHNAAFERWVNWNIMVPRYGFPRITIAQQRCSMIKCRAWSLPPALAMAGDVLNLAIKKDKRGDALIKLFCIPQNPTKNQPKTRILPTDRPDDAQSFYDYNATDIATEAELSSRVPDLPQPELDYWFLDQEINARGVHVDREGIEACIAIIEAAHEQYNTELCLLTDGAIERASQTIKLQEWLATLGCHLFSMDEENVSAKIKQLVEGEYLPGDLRDANRCLRALEIRATIGSSSVKKVFAMRNQLTRDDRLHDLFTGHGARTGRPTGNGPQPTNLPNSGPMASHCQHCFAWYPEGIICTACGGLQSPDNRPTDWNADAAADALATIKTRSIVEVERRWGDAMFTVAGCLRALFTAAPGMELISSDYTAIEAVVNAALAGEQWRMDVFRTHGKIYEASAAKMFNVNVQEILDYPLTHGGSKHYLRDKGKRAELGLGFLGWVNALRSPYIRFEGTDEEAKALCIAWRDASPAIVYLGGGQYEGRGYQRQAKLYGLEGMAVAAVQNPGTEYVVARRDGSLSGLSFQCTQDVLYLRLPSDRRIAYHRPRLAPAKDAWRGLSLSYEGYNTNPLNGPHGWLRMPTYAGKILENAVQATANDILRHGQMLLEYAGYPIVLHVYDENVAEIPLGTGSIAQFEAIMSTLPAWAADANGPWPIKAQGGWRGERYRK